MFRASFHSQHALPEGKKFPHHQGHRLTDCILTIVNGTDDGYMVDSASGEFCVVDTKTREKAFCDMPHGATPASVKSMIESHFDASAFRVTDKLWIV